MRLGRATRLLVLVALFVLVALPSAATAHGRVVVGIGPWWDPFWPYASPYYAYGPPYWYPPYYAYPPPVVEDPPIYIQREPAPPVGQESTLPAGYWYYCPSASGPGYYPSVPTCAEPWVPVAPRSSTGDGSQRLSVPPAAPTAGVVVRPS